MLGQGLVRHQDIILKYYGILPTDNRWPCRLESFTSKEEQSAYSKAPADRAHTVWEMMNDIEHKCKPHSIIIKHQIRLENTSFYKLKHLYTILIRLVGRVFTNGQEDQGSIPGRVIPKTLKIVLDTSLLNTQWYKERIKGKVEQSREKSSALPYTLVWLLLKKGPSGLPWLRSSTTTYTNQKSLTTVCHFVGVTQIIFR